MKLCSDWMQLRPDVIYLTGGASQNSLITQIVADIFQAKVQRLSQSGSVSLGAAMRAAHNTFSYRYSIWKPNSEKSIHRVPARLQSILVAMKLRLRYFPNY